MWMRFALSGLYWAGLLIKHFQILFSFFGDVCGRSHTLKLNQQPADGGTEVSSFKIARTHSSVR